MTRRRLPPEKLTNPRVRAYLSVLRVHERLLTHFHSLFKRHGLSAPKYNVLRILRGAGPDGLPSREIARRMVTRVPDITRLVDRLESEALVARQRSAEDRRVVRVQATPKALTLLQKLDPVVLEIHDKQFEALSAHDVDVLNRLLEKLLAGADPR